MVIEEVVSKESPGYGKATEYTLEIGSRCSALRTNNHKRAGNPEEGARLCSPNHSPLPAQPAATRTPESGPASTEEDFAASWPRDVLGLPADFDEVSFDSPQPL